MQRKALISQLCQLHGRGEFSFCHELRSMRILALDGADYEDGGYLDP